MKTLIKKINDLYGSNEKKNLYFNENDENYKEVQHLCQQHLIDEDAETCFNNSIDLISEGYMVLPKVTDEERNVLIKVNDGRKVYYG